MHSSNHIIKFADDTIVVGLINKDDESAYREEVRELMSWCKVNNLYLNVDKTKEMVVDFRRARRDHSPHTINGSSVEIIRNTKFFGVHLAENLTWILNTSFIIKRAQQQVLKNATVLVVTGGDYDMVCFNQGVSKTDYDMACFNQGVSKTDYDMAYFNQGVSKTDYDMACFNQGHVCHGTAGKTPNKFHLHIVFSLQWMAFSACWLFSL
ncbi:hypothetical protein P4O66_012460 [Electrophorus voltai]|uniref:Reverse transcriptase domain-containing protein n=1 Tax=Electrophorus voltai TaxID=2609070 RepID=A0AAD8Z6Z8_9TELE|nr:hypothetical protein P4O66_012460 [Electrophorus voltai]